MGFPRSQAFLRRRHVKQPIRDRVILRLVDDVSAAGKVVSVTVVSLAVSEIDGVAASGAVDAEVSVAVEDSSVDGTGKTVMISAVLVLY